MLPYAFKEWAVICEALAQGKQSILLRKGGSAEEFAVEETRFWLYPTYVHQQHEGIQAEARPLLEHVLADRHAEGKVRLQLWAEITGAYQICDELRAMLLSHLHFWSEDTVRKRFNYRNPGLFVLVVRMHRMPQAIEIDERPEYEGCKSWVTLERGLSTEGSTPVLDDASFRILQRQLDLLLSPTAYA
jgi:hypothetical protein